MKLFSAFIFCAVIYFFGVFMGWSADEMRHSRLDTTRDHRAICSALDKMENDLGIQGKDKFKPCLS